MPDKTVQLSFRLPHKQASALKKALIDQSIGVQHFFETVAGVMVDFNGGKTDGRTSTEFRRLVVRSLELKHF